MILLLVFLLVITCCHVDESIKGGLKTVVYEESSTSSRLRVPGTILSIIYDAKPPSSSQKIIMKKLQKITFLLL